MQLPDIKALAGVPLTDPNGKRFGTFCIADREARQWTDAEINPAQLRTAGQQ